MGGSQLEIRANSEVHANVAPLFQLWPNPAMSICTKTGDSGTTGLMYNRRVSKTHPRIEACGAIDEVNAAIGLARATAEEDFIRANLLPIQQTLITVMGEIATLKEDLDRYAKDGFQLVTAETRVPLERLIGEIESQKVSFKGWATPGATVNAGHLDFARAVCRRAERRVQELLEVQEISNGDILIYLNRLSDLLWLMARWVENSSESRNDKRERWCQ
jgi:cob(I)alamin adenosyltransferase